MSDAAAAAAAAAAAPPSSSSPPPHSDEPTSPVSVASEKASRPAPDSPEPSSEANGEAASAAPASKAPKLPPRQRLRTNEGDKELGAPSDDAYSRKRDREGSMEPSAITIPGMTHSASGPIPTKKNRLQSTKESAGPGETEADVDAAEKDKDEEDHAVDASAPSTLSTSEGVKVGQIRKRVRDLQWEGQEGDKDEGEAQKKTLVDAEAAPTGTEKDADDSKDKASQASPTAENSKDAAETAPARTQPSFSSFSSKPSAFSTATSSSSPFSTAAAATSPGRTQPTFSSFSSSTSPFSKGSADVAGPSWLAGSGSAKPLGGTGSSSGPGLKPSALGSNLGKTKAASPPPSTLASSSSSAKDGPSTNTSPKPKPATGGLGFGAFAGSNAFASAVKTAAAKGGQSNGLDSDSKDDEDSKDSSVAAKSPSAGPDAKSESDGKPKISALSEADLATGEEDERSVYSARAKLYVMDPKDQSWKERGTGTLRCNVPRSYVGGRRKGARLVMRAEGVLRLILNVALFAGMKVEPAQDKFVRLVALEEGKLVHFAIKLSNPSGASGLYNIISEHIPEEGRSTATAVTSWGDDDEA